MNVSNLIKHRPLSWLYLIYAHEKNRVKHNNKANKWELSNDFIQHKRCEPWFRDKGDETLRLNYPLSEKSIVFDVGGYKGEFATSIMNKYNCIVHTFEPIPEFYSIIENKFSNNNKLISHRFGLSNRTHAQQIAVLDNSSSVFASSGDKIQIQLKNVIEFMQENEIAKVDLIKINIEGGEYDLLECLIQNNLINSFVNIQVQFHDFVIENARNRMSNIQSVLSKTHELTYQYDFVWENWKLKCK